MQLTHLIFSLGTAVALLWGLNGASPASVVPTATARPASMPVFLRTHTDIGPHLNQGTEPHRALCHVTGPRVDVTMDAPGIVWLPVPQGPEDVLSISCAATEVAENRQVIGQMSYAPMNLTLRRKMRKVPFQTSVAGAVMYWRTIHALEPDPSTDVYAYAHVLALVLREERARPPL